jgi:hypothetical protein
LKRHLQLAVGVGVSLVCLWLAIRGRELGTVGRALAGAGYIWLIPALALYFAGVWLRSLRWRHLLLPIADLPAARLFAIVVIGYAANDVLPARLGEVVRCYILRRRYGIPTSTALGTVLLERMLDGVTMLVFMAGALLFLPFSLALYQLMAGAAVVFGGGVVVLVVVVARPALAQHLVAVATRPLPAALGARVRLLATSFFGGLTALGGAGATLRVFALSCAAWLLEVGMYFSLMFAFPLTPSFALATLTTAVANLGTLIPSSPGYVGVFDFLGRSVLGQFGVPAETALAYILVVHAALVVPITVLGFWYAWREGGVRLLLPGSGAGEMIARVPPVDVPGPPAAVAARGTASSGGTVSTTGTTSTTSTEGAPT